ncbi:MAG: hypothetical protein RL456_174, partial [Pseudomonadota bacterium]
MTDPIRRQGIEELEARILYSADAALLLGSVPVADVRGLDASRAGSAPAPDHRAWLVADRRAQDWDLRWADLQATADGTPGLSLVDPAEDGARLLAELRARAGEGAAIEVLPWTDAQGRDWLGGTAWGGEAPEAAQAVATEIGAETDADADADSPWQLDTRRELVVIDGGIEGAGELALHWWSQAGAGRQLDVVMLDAGRDGLDQLDALLATRRDLAALHLVTHGAEGLLQLGTTRLDAAALQSRAAAVAGWGEALADGGDLMVWGCDVAAGAAGQLFVGRLAALTGADVAASDDPTGSEAMGGDWTLEYQYGSIAPEHQFQADQLAAFQSWQGLLATYTVFSTADSGVGTLRQAILDANANAGADQIHFSLIGGAPYTIALASALPSISDRVVIDGTTDASYLISGGRPVVVLDGGNAIADGLQLYGGSDGSTVRGLVIQRFTQDGIDMSDSGSHTIAGNWIGLAADGTTGAGNQQGVNLWNSSGNTIGGTTAADRNVISANTGPGVFVGGTSTGNVIRGNHIGTDRTGTTALGNANFGVLLMSGGNTVGGAAAGAGNVIAGSLNYHGVAMAPGADGNVVAGNLIGVNAAGTAALGHAGYGIHVESSGNLIGGTTAAERNVISGNETGIVIEGVAATGNLVRGNLIGTNAAGTGAIANNLEGVRVSGGASGNMIGGTAAGAGNLIAYNDSDGIEIIDAATASTAVLGNRIFGHGPALVDLGLDLSTSGVSANDALDADTGANGVQNFPELGHANATGGHTVVTGRIDTTPATTLRIEFFSSATASASGHGEAETYLGATSVTTDATGQATFATTLAGVSVTAGHAVTATATVDLGGGNYGATSEFAANVIATALPPGISVMATPISISETGTSATFSVVLDSAPAANVTVPLSVADGTELSVSPASLTFTPQDWNIARTVTVTGLDDALADGDMTGSVIVGPAVSSDPDYHGLDPSDVTVTNRDDDLWNTVVVDTTADTLDGTTSSIAALLASRGADGRISLREAMLAAGNTANGPGGADRIVFDIADPLVGGAHTITLAHDGIDAGVQVDALPTMADAVVIDGTTDPDFAGTPIVVIDGSAAATGSNGLTLTGGDSTVRGLVIQNFASGYGIMLENGGRNVIEGNRVGTNLAGTAAAPNDWGVVVWNSADNRIGGTAAGAGNLLSGNHTDGVNLIGAGATGNVVEGNLIGTNAAGTGSVANQGVGVWVGAGASGNLIGGTSVASRNLIAGNTNYGLVFQDAATTGNTAQGNWIGLNALGTGAISNGGYGVVIDLAAADTSVLDNVIAGNTQPSWSLLSGGMYIYGIGATVQGNVIGMDPTGTFAIANGGGTSDNAGIHVQDGSLGILIGGTGAGQGNLIGGNLGPGIAVKTLGRETTVLGNAFRDNGGLSIDLGHDGLTLNDAGDTDSGPNSLLNFPVLYNAVTAGAVTTITGEVRTEAATPLRVEFFVTPVGTEDPTGYGEGRQFIGAVDVTTDATGYASVSTTLAGLSLAAGDRVSATATLRTGASTFSATSEMSMNVPASVTPAGITVQVPGGAISLAEGGSGTFTVVLDTAPTADVTIDLVSVLPSQFALSTGQLTFTAADWNVAQTVTVTSVDDTLVDGAFGAILQVRPAVSADPAYHGLDATDLATVTTDDDTFNTVAVTTTSDVADGDTASLAALMANRGADGEISLREAIAAANNTANGSSADRIVFSIAEARVGGAHVISPGSALPSITDAVVIDGSSEPDAGAGPVVVLNGIGAGALTDGLVLGAGSAGSTIRGLVIHLFNGDGIEVTTTGNTIAGNFIGTDVTGTVDVGNSGSGVRVSGDANLIGGTTAADRNLISGNNTHGVLITGASATGNTVAGNHIGTDRTGTLDLGNTLNGVTIAAGATSNTVGGATTSSRNVIAGNNDDGVEINGEATDGNAVQMNWIGLGSNGSSVIGNSGDGIFVVGGADLTVIGGNGLGNVVVGSGLVGIEIDGASNGGTIRGNFIGTDETLTVSGGQQENGVLLENGVTNVTLGGTTAGDGNVITQNGLGGAFTDGISVKGNSTIQNAFLGNRIYGNAGLGVDLADDGVTGNDLGDVDTGPNWRQNTPVLTSAVSTGGNTTITGSLDSTVSRNFRIEFFSSPTGDASGAGEGQTYLGFALVTTDGSGLATIHATLTGVTVTVGHQVTAMATDLVMNHTSEFAANVAATSVAPGISVGAIGGNTTEAGGTATFTVVLDAAPTADVTIPVSVSPAAEGSVSAAPLIFTLANWSTPQTVTVTGQDDTLDDGDRGYTVVLGPASSTDLAYDGMNPADVAVVNLDDDTFNTIVVDTTSDTADGDTSSLSALLANKGADGFISLREAIAATNATANGTGADRIAFDIAGTGAHTIGLASALPAITEAVVLDATTDDSFAANGSRPAIVIDGNGVAGDGLVLMPTADGSTIRGFVIRDIGGHAIWAMAGSDGHTIAGNWIGQLDADGTDLGVGEQNAGLGIALDGAYATVGGSTAADANVIVGHMAHGIAISAADAHHNRVQGNLIGVGPDGTTPIGQGVAGIVIASGANDNLIGGTGAGEGNVIAANDAGVLVWDAVTFRNAILGNVIRDSVGLGIDLGSDGVTANDAGDADGGPNDLQNTPVLAWATSGAGTTTVRGTLQSQAFATYRVELFGSATGDASGHGEASAYLGSASVTTDAAGLGSFEAVLAGTTLAGGSVVTATATEDLGGGTYGSTSEFSANVTVTGLPPGVTVVPAGTTVSEAGGTTHFTVVLDTAPTADVTIALSVANARELSLSASALTFTAANWNVAQTVTVTGVDDTVVDGAVLSDVVTAAAASADPAYDGLAVADIAVTSTDDDTVSTVVVTTVSDVADGDTSSLVALMASQGADGRISLREAILAANASANGSGGADRIHFDIPEPLVSGAHTIDVTSDLPTVTDAVVIDGTTEPDHAGSPVIHLSDAGAGTVGMALTGTGSTMRGLSITGFDGLGLRLNGQGHVIAGNWIGVRPDGFAAPSSLAHGILVGGSGNLIGGSTAADRNIIGNASYAAITLNGAQATGNRISGNYLGLTADGVTAATLSNYSIGLFNGASGNIIGTDGDGLGDAGEGNLIADGWFSAGPGGMTTLTVAGNRFGLNGADSPTGGGGYLDIAGGTTVRIGTDGDGVSDALEANVIAGTLGITGAVTDLRVAGNFFGVASDGVTGLASGGSGILVSGDAVGVIGGTAAGLGNTIATHGDAGIGITGAGARVAILGNVIRDNQGLGIDLGPAGVTANDALDADADTGANALQNAPVITGAHTYNGDTTVTGTLDTTPGATFVVEFFSSPVGDASGHGEAGSLLGRARVTTDGTGQGGFTAVFSGAAVPAGQVVTATATEDLGGGAWGGTSEFAANATVVGAPPPVVAGISVVRPISGVSDEVRVNTTTANIQYGPDINARNVGFDASGGMVMVWASDRQDGDRWGLYAQRFDANGVPVGGEILVNATTAGNQNMPALAVLPDGSFIVAWQSDAQAAQIDIMARRFAADGTALSGEIAVNTTTFGVQQLPSIAADSLGNFVVVWEHRNGGNFDILGQRFDAAGTPQGGEFTVHAATGNTDQNLGSIAMNSAGDFVVVWTGYNTDGDQGGVYGRRFDASGAALGDDFLINQTTAGQLAGAEVAIDAQGGFIVAWMSDPGGVGNGGDIYARRYSSVGAALTGEFQVNTTTANYQGHASVGAAPGGNFVISWTSDQQDGDGMGIVARRYSAGGVAMTPEFAVNATTTGGQDYSNVAFAPDGDFVIAWEGNGAGDDAGVFMRRYSVQARTTEAGGTATFEVLLDTAPTSDVTLVLGSSDPTEGLVSPAALTFTSANWNVPQTVTVTGLPDAVADPATAYTVTLAPATSADPAYNGLDPLDVAVTNVEAGLVVTTASDVADGDTRSIAALMADRGADGLVSLREALLAANATAGLDRITFAVAGTGVHTLVLGSLLPAITDAVILDASTDESHAANGARPAFEIDGQSVAGSGLVLAAGSGGSTVRGLSLVNFQQSGLWIASGSDGNLVVGNFLGLRADGSMTGANSFGLTVASAGNRIGGTSATDRNVLSGNINAGIELAVGSSSAVVTGNFIGTDATGLLDRGNGHDGIFLSGGADHRIGGTAAGEGNVISGNSRQGLEIFGPTALRAVVQGNLIGADATGTAAMGNGAGGLWIGMGADQVMVGGTEAGAGNLIAWNTSWTTEAGLMVAADAGSVAVLGNRFVGNQSLAIDLGMDGATANDPLDADTGANGLQNFPVIAEASTTGTSVTIRGTLSSEPSADYRLEFFRVSTGERLGAASVTTDAAGTAAFDTGALVASLPAGETVVATATRMTGPATYTTTSEFSAAVAAQVQVNRAPVLDGMAALTFDALTEDDLSPAGQTVASLLASAGDPVTDADVGAVEGIAVIGATPGAGGGRFEFSTDGGATWQALGSPSEGAARLLRDSDWLRHVPGGAVAETGTLTLRAWDRSTGVAGTTADASVNGGSTAFSTATAVATVTVTGVNDNPTFGDGVNGLLDGAPVHVEGGNGVVLDADVTLLDIELQQAGSHDGATLTLERQGGANPEDQLAFDGAVVTVSGTDVFVSGVQVGTYLFTGGRMDIAFGPAATQARVDALVQQIHYWIASDAPPAQVVIAWTYRDGNTGAQGAGGERTVTGTTTVTLTGTNDAPLLVGSGAGGAYVENGPAVAADAGLTVADPDSADFSGGTLAVSLFAAGTSNDLLALAHQGQGAGQVGVSGNVVSFGGVAVGTWSGGVGVSPLVVSFGAAADAAAVQAVARAVVFSTAGDAISDNPRTVRMTLTDGDGGTSANLDVVVTAEAVNDPPSVFTIATARVNQDMPLVFGAGQLTLQDADATIDPMEMTLVATGGTVTLASLGGLSFSVGDGTDDATLTVTGLASDLSAALSGLVFTPDAGRTGAAQLRLDVSDLGNRGTGVAMTASGTVAITVDPVNHAPTSLTLAVAAPTLQAVDAAAVVNATVAGAQALPDVAMLSGDRQVVVWAAESVDGSGTAVVGRWLDAAGAPVGGEFAVSVTAAGSQTAPRIAARVGGGFVVTWQSDGQDGSGWGVYARVFDDAGVALGGEIAVAAMTAGAQSEPAVAATADGGFVVVHAGDLADGAGRGVVAQRFDASGAALGGPIAVNATTADDQGAPSVAAVPSGGFVVAWQSRLQDGDGLGVVARRFDAAGVALGGEIVVNTATAGDQLAPAVAVRGDGTWAVAWKAAS